MSLFVKNKPWLLFLWSILMIVMLLADGIITVLSLRHHQPQVSLFYMRFKICSYLLGLSNINTSENSLLSYDYSSRHFGQFKIYNEINHVNVLFFFKVMWYFHHCLSFSSFEQSSIGLYQQTGELFLHDYR